MHSLHLSKSESVQALFVHEEEARMGTCPVFFPPTNGSGDTQVSV